MSGSDARLFAARYRAVRRLGVGATATVFLARDERLDREVAVKRVHGAEVTAETALRLQREARIMASLRHPNLVTVFDMVTDADDLLLIMEYVQGRTLAEVFATGRWSGSARWRCCGRWRRRWMRCIARASCIAISSRRTSSWRATA